MNKEQFIASGLNEEQAAKAAASVKELKGFFPKAPSSKTDNEDYSAKLIVANVVFPELKDEKLQQSYGVMGAENLLQHSKSGRLTASTTTLTRW